MKSTMLASFKQRLENISKAVFLVVATLLDRHRQRRQILV